MILSCREAGCELHVLREQNVSLIGNCSHYTSIAQYYSIPRIQMIVLYHIYLNIVLYHIYLN
jgi:hypothetical protein